MLQPDEKQVNEKGPVYHFYNSVQGKLSLSAAGIFPLPLPEQWKYGFLKVPLLLNKKYQQDSAKDGLKECLGHQNCENHHQYQVPQQFQNPNPKRPHQFHDGLQLMDVTLHAN